MLCEVCGAVLEGKFAAFCPYCGMRQDCAEDDTPGYVQEILERGFSALRDDDFSMAVRYFECVLSDDPENGRANLGMLMTVAGVHDEAELAEFLMENAQQDDVMLKAYLRRVMEVSPDEMNEVFRDEYHDARALMRAEKYAEALRIFRDIMDYHTDASYMAGECMRQLAGVISGKLRPSVSAGEKKCSDDSEIEGLCRELEEMRDRYIEAIDVGCPSTPDDEYIFAVNASRLEHYVRLLCSGYDLPDDIRKLRYMNDARAVLRMTREFLERRIDSYEDTLTQDTADTPEQPAMTHEASDIPGEATLTHDTVDMPEQPAMTHESSDTPEQPAMTHDSSDTPEQAMTHDSSDIPRWLKLAIITIGLIILALMFAPTLSEIIALL